MIAIILAAGRGTRMKALTDMCPKPMLEIAGKNLIERKLEALPKEITSVIIVVGYRKEMITEYFGTSWNGMAIQYVVQPTLSGTGGAIDLCKDQLKNEEQFMVLMGDDLFSKEDLEKLVTSSYSILVDDQGEAGTKKGWQVFFDKHNMLMDIHEQVEDVVSPYINAGAYTLGKEYFSQPVYRMSNGEYSLPNTLVDLINRKKKEDSPLAVHVVVTELWVQITTPESIVEAEKRLE